MSSIELGLALPARPRLATALSQAPWLALVLALLCALVFAASGDRVVLNVLAHTFLFAGLATAWNIIGGYGGQFSLAHGVFFAAGAYLAANLHLHHGISPWVSLAPAALLCAALAVAISWPTFRLRGPFFAIATLAFNEVAFVLANYAESITGGPRGLIIPFRPALHNMIFRDRLSYALLMLGFLAVCLVVSLLVWRSRLGYALQAVRDNDEAARACGIDVLRTKLAGMGISAALTGAGGVLFLMYVRVIDPPTLLTLPEIGVKFALISLIGGVGTLYGPLLGAALIMPLENWLRTELSGVVPGGHLIVLGTVLVLAALFLKRGIVGAIGDLAAARRRGAT